MTAQVNHGKTKTTAKRPAASTRKRRLPCVSPKEVREEYGISRPLFAQLLGVAKDTLTAWENGRAKDANDLAKIEKVEKVADLLKGLSRVMPKASIAGWLDSPNEACRSAGERTPADLMQKGRYDKIEAMIYFFESGVAF